MITAPGVMTLPNSESENTLLFTTPETVPVGSCTDLATHQQLHHMKFHPKFMSQKVKHNEIYIYKKGIVKMTRDAQHGHMTCQNLNFHCTHEEGQGISFASSFITFQLTSGIAQNLTGHVTVRRVSVVVLTIVWSI